MRSPMGEGGDPQRSNTETSLGNSGLLVLQGLMIFRRVESSLLYL